MKLEKVMRKIVVCPLLLLLFADSQSKCNKFSKKVGS
ncbi:MAG: hypothetical protein H6R18_801 [Proteobacteria bacterium]|nr:hypothetical protein [Pseudomonadota bacterium]